MPHSSSGISPVRCTLISIRIFAGTDRVRRWAAATPLPAPFAFARTVGRLGIEPGDAVVAYDDKGGAHAAARFWWMMRALGHEAVALLDGGIDAAVQAGIETEAGEAPDRRPADYPAPTQWKLPTADLDFVRRQRAEEDWLLLDVRAAPRYRGDAEPFDPVAGHIPGAVNAPYETNLDETGRFLDSPQLRERYESLLAGRRPDRVVVSCGSGVTACHTLAALERAGLTGASLYVGSFSEWCRSEEPCAKGDTP